MKQDEIGESPPAFGWERVCRNNCIVPAAILKAMEVTASIFLPGDCSIVFVEGAIGGALLRGKHCA